MPERVQWTDLLDEQGPLFRDLYGPHRTPTGFVTVPPGHDAGPTAPAQAADQVFYILRGQAEFQVWGKDRDGAPWQRRAKVGNVVVVPAGARHHVRSSGDEPLSFLSVYAPAQP